MHVAMPPPTPYQVAARLCLFGAFSAYIAASYTLIVTLVGYGLRNPWVNPGFYLDFAVLIALAVGLQRQSRVAAGLLVLYWVASMSAQLVNVPGLGHEARFWYVALSFLASFSVGAMGTWKVHRSGLG